MEKTEEEAKDIEKDFLSQAKELGLYPLEHLVVLPELWLNYNDVVNC